MAAQKTGFRVSVRELVAFTFPPVDIVPASQVEDMLAGGKAHRLRQDGHEGRTEMSIRHVFHLAGEDVELFGRMDAFTEDCPPLIEEMKLSSWRGDDAAPEHQAQAWLYGAMVALEHGAHEVRLAVTYLSPEGEVLRRHEECVAGEKLIAQAEAWLSAYLAFLVRERQHRERRDQSLRELAFPFPEYRQGQRELAVQVYTAVRQKRRLFASLPTGTGKSAAVLFPALKALGEGETEKILYLTCRNTARQSPLQALERMKQQGLHARISVLTAKEKLCPGECRCHPDWCDRAKGHYLRAEEAIRELLENPALLWTDEVIADISDKYRICPFELALALTELADVVLMDLNYVFDPFAQVKRLYQRKRGVTLLVDEAHHVQDRVQESLSGELNSGQLRKSRTALGKGLSRKHPCYKALTELIHLLRAFELPQENEDGRLEHPPAEVTAAAQRLLEEVGGLLNHPQGVPAAELLPLLRTLLPFLYAAEHFSDDYAVLLSAQGKERTLDLYCLLPAAQIAATTKGMRGVVFFSATLSPLDAMKELLGGGEEDACFSLPSPFPRENLQVVRQRVNTRYAARRDSAPRVAEIIAQTAMQREGKYIAFFPSYAYLQMVQELLPADRLPPMWVQRRDIGEEERDSFFAAFLREDGPRLGLCVMGGLFSEGIDLPGDSLIGAMIVGVGLPTPSPKLRAMQQCYAERFGDGFAYACRIPAMQKVQQAGGRIIRSGEDKGILVLIDERYFEPAYVSLLPEHWRQFSPDVERAAKELWG